jgi:hypothetical protein
VWQSPAVTSVHDCTVAGRHFACGNRPTATVVRFGTAAPDSPSYTASKIADRDQAPLGAIEERFGWTG